MLTESLRSTIQLAYRNFLRRNSLHPRQGQRQMIAEIARCLTDVELDADGAVTCEDVRLTTAWMRLTRPESTCSVACIPRPIVNGSVNRRSSFSATSARSRGSSLSSTSW